MKNFKKLFLFSGLSLTLAPVAAVAVSCKDTTETKENTTTNDTVVNNETQGQQGGQNNVAGATETGANEAEVALYKAPLMFANETKTFNGNQYVYNGAKLLEKAKAKMAEKASSIQSSGALLQKYSAGGTKNANPAAFGIKSGGNSQDNIILTFKEGVDPNNILSTLPAEKNNKNKLFEGSLDEATRTLTIKFKTTLTGDEVLEQSFVFDEVVAPTEGNTANQGGTSMENQNGTANQGGTSMENQNGTANQGETTNNQANADSTSSAQASETATADNATTGAADAQASEMTTSDSSTSTETSSSTGEMQADSSSSSEGSQEPAVAADSTPSPTEPTEPSTAS
ncbi:Vmc-like lipoprotein signal peptide domain-containing protein [Mycoplasma nasistruthionis]|uniref:Variable surface lipoprotein n=1 Tax=Mycoplasma nasistruthionis TaxID=353852 RepID=A0A4Y6I6C5_9MOLU|nr:hypothetical protein [Mycoplasma nasistruthionis]QCZ36626.1 hypothetical protein FG904_01155 [Mycoplasma nasistruthionis]QDF64921.1 hypothetical protein FIV53_01175 [Mycoplasma nasistruthionis]